MKKTGDEVAGFLFVRGSFSLESSRLLWRSSELVMTLSQRRSPPIILQRKPNGRNF
jgi:hypothetical protein